MLRCGVSGAGVSDRVYNVELWREQDAAGTIFWVCRHPALPGCLAQGNSPREALANLDEARQLYLEGLAWGSVPLPDEEEGLLIHQGGIRVYD